MCGIFGTLNRSIDNPAQILNDLNHRGPDTHGSITVGPLSMLHTRLAIQELGEEGRQPMQCGRWVMAFNGEIYNHRELRRRYGLLLCQSASDTETLLHLWQQLGVAMLPELDGMFALAVFDTMTQRLWLARDRFGEKPLYVWLVGSELVFCSELRALQQYLPLAMNRASLSRYCQLGYFWEPRPPIKTSDKSVLVMLSAWSRERWRGAKHAGVQWYHPFIQKREQKTLLHIWKVP